MVKINEKLCIGCNACVKDCFVENIYIEDGYAKIKGECINCGHCVAVCPTKAVSMPEYTMESVVEYEENSFHIPADRLLNFIKFRRTIRQFKDKTVEEEKIKQIIEAGRHTPTGSNLQNVRYIVVREQLQPLRESILKKLNKLAGEQKGNPVMARYADGFRAMYQSYQQDPSKEDKLFFHAPVALIVVSNDVLPAALASTSMELQANALGIGSLYSGFSTRAINTDEDCRTLLNLADNENAITVMVLGYPDVTYHRTAPRKSPEITIL